MPYDFQDGTPRLVDGVAAYDDGNSRSGDDAVVVEFFADGSVQIKTVTARPAKSQKYRYQFSSQYGLLVNEDGSVNITQAAR